jgi:glycerol-3-phosphate O-acyltransferase
VTRESVIERALELRDLLKFDFFFSSTEEFVEDIGNEIDRYTLGKDQEDGSFVFDLGSFHPKSPIVLGPFFEAYFVVAATLIANGADPVTNAMLAERALRMGDQLAAHGDISNKEAVSSALFATGTKLALSRGLLDGTEQERKDFHSELEEILETLTSMDTWNAA